MELRKAVCITGMPRSGTSWIGQLFDASPFVAFRMEPIWAYSLKNEIGMKSDKNDIVSFFERAREMESDDFMIQAENRAKGAYTSFEKCPHTPYLVYKTTRHFNITQHILESLNLDEFSVICVVRDPRGAINSWMKTPREFGDKGCTEADWRHGDCRNREEGEYWGFDNWLASTRLFVDLVSRYSNCLLVQYEDVVGDVITWLEEMYRHAGVPLSDTSYAFARDSQQRNDPNPYAVFKSTDVADAWRCELPEEISSEIVSSVTQAGFQRFLR